MGKGDEVVETLLYHLFPCILFLFRCPSCPTFFTEVRFFIAELLIVILEELPPIVFLATGTSIATFFAARFAFLFVSRSIVRFTSTVSGRIVTFSRCITAFFVFEATLLAIKLLFSVTASFAFTSAFRSFLAFFAGNLHRNLTTVPVGSV